MTTLGGCGEKKKEKKRLRNMSKNMAEHELEEAGAPQACAMSVRGIGR